MFVKKHNVWIETPEIGEEKDDSDVFIIRHALSEFNYLNFLQRNHEEADE